MNHLRERVGKTDNKSDNISGIFRHYPVAFSPKSAASFSLGKRLGVKGVSCALGTFPCQVDPHAAHLQISLFSWPKVTDAT
jgi:hypothetical protein